MTTMEVLKKTTTKRLKKPSAVLHNFLDQHQLRGYYPPV
jgi:hypothetical protein